MTINEIQSKSILRKSKKIDPWFITQYGMNLYRGCLHNCAYCDGRAESYYVEGELGKDVTVKSNAIEILKRELDPKRKRKPFSGSFILIGGGVCDSYEAVDKKYELSRKALELIYEFGHPVHILTKSSLIERDLELIEKINRRRKAIVSFSFSSVDEKVSSIFEPGVSAPQARLNTLSKFKSLGIYCGMFLMPVIPLITDTPEMINQSLSAAKNINLDYVVFSGMTLKPGKQKDYFMKILQNHYPELVKKYHRVYDGNKWGNPSERYYQYISKNFFEASQKFLIPTRIPHRVFSHILNTHDLLVVMLEQISYQLKLSGEKSQYSYVAHQISKLDDKLKCDRSTIRELNGMNDKIFKTIEEILETRNSELYDNLFSGTELENAK